MTQPLDTLLLAQICDAVGLLLWSRTKAAEEGQEPPSGVFAALMGQSTGAAKKAPCEGFESREAFKRAWGRG